MQSAVEKEGAGTGKPVGAGALFKGMLVELPGRRGIGKLESVADGRYAVSVFHSLLHSELIELSVEDLTRAYLSPQTRVYLDQDGRFRVGRVIGYLMHDNGLVDYEVRFPNGRQQPQVPEFANRLLTARAGSLNSTASIRWRAICPGSGACRTALSR